MAECFPEKSVCLNEEEKCWKFCYDNSPLPSAMTFKHAFSSRSTEVQVFGALCRHYDRPESQDDTAHAIPAARHNPPECNSGRASEWR